MPGWIDAASGGIGGLLSTGLSAIFNRGSQKRAMKWQTSEREASQEYNTSEREASQNFQDQQRVAQNAYAEDIYQNYQSPEAMVRQYKAAGLNPALAADGGSAGSISASSGSSGGAPSGTHVSTPGSPATPFMPYEGMMAGFQSMSQVLKNLADARKSGVETDQLEKQFGEVMRQWKLDNDSKELLLSIDKKYLSDKALATLQSIQADVVNKTLTGDELRKRIDLLGKELHLKQNEIDTWYQTFNKNMEEQQSRIDANNASVRESYAKADESFAKARYTRESIANLHKELEVMSSVISKNNADAALTSQTMPLVIDKLASEADKTDSETLINSVKYVTELIQQENGRARLRNLVLNGSEEVPGGHITQEVARLVWSSESDTHEDDWNRAENHIKDSGYQK